jgi:cell division protein FtsI (penicillin-binding protein 3)
MTAPVFAPPRLPLAWRWLGRWVWSLEHAFERARAAAAPQDSRLRIAFVMAIFAFAYLVVAIGAMNQALFSESRGRGAGAAAPAAARSDLVDRHGALLAADLPHFALYIDPREVWDIPATREALSRLAPGFSEKRLTRILEGGKRSFLLGGLDPEQRRRIHDLGLPGLSFEDDERRVYPLGRTAAHLIGFSDTGGAGLAGVERAFDADIRAGSPQGGGGVPLSIDLRIQAALEDELHKAAAEFQPVGAVGIVTNVRTGEILGMTSWPDFDPNAPGAASDNARLNRAAASVFEMGSTFKAFTVAIGLDTGVATMDSIFDAREPYRMGYRTIQDYHAARKILTLTEVFQHSSNIGTAKLAESIGPRRMQRYFDGMGLTRPAKVELRESATPITPRKWDMDAVASTSFGHGINVSPLALTAAYGAALNGGVAVPLTVRKLAPGAKVEGTRVFSQRTSALMLQIMRANVTGGSGGSADAPGLSVGGKTGTGEKYDSAIRRYSNSRQVSSFAAVFPTEGGADTERYFVLILLDEPKPSARTYGYSTGGWVAAPAAGRVIDRIAPFLGVRRNLALPAPASAAAPVSEGL